VSVQLLTGHFVNLSVHPTDIRTIRVDKAPFRLSAQERAEMIRRQWHRMTLIDRMKMRWHPDPIAILRNQFIGQWKRNTTGTTSPTLFSPVDFSSLHALPYQIVYLATM
jgi:hypothetical protein